ncbi:MAG: hypothetical protein CMJ46_03360 [Planctomyces sp.]|nr:hypothetical protein [Planctomyces sp.]
MLPDAIKNRVRWLIKAAAALLLFLSMTQSAEAGKFSLLRLILQRGENVVTITQLPETRMAMNEDGELIPMTVGYHYEYFSVLWMDVWTWNGQYVLAVGDTYAIAPGNIEMFLTEEQNEELSVPWRYRFPLGLVVFSIGVVALLVKAVRFEASTTTRGRELLKNPRYAEVIDRMKEEQVELENWAVEQQRLQDSGESPQATEAIHDEFRERQQSIIQNTRERLFEAGMPQGKVDDNLKAIVDYLAFKEELDEITRLDEK